MRQEIRPALGVLAGLGLVTGLLYPLLVTALGGLVFPNAAHGSLVYRQGRAAGSALIGQPFSDPRHFHGRPSATAGFPCNPLASGGSNLGPLDPRLETAVRERVAALRTGAPGDGSPVPPDLVTASASGLDPHVSLEGALYQVARVATARGMPEEEVRRLVLGQVEGRTFGVLGEPRVNVLRLNLALDDLDPGPGRAGPGR